MKKLTDHDFKAIIARRDRRFDGRFYFGVKTTRIYCRPICPAKPKAENIVIFKSLSEAEHHGYRACLRCRPDAAPHSKLFNGTLNTVSRALRLIQESAKGELDMTQLAESLGVTDRHLRRLFDEHLGASPIEIIITQRLHFARQMLQETDLPIAEIAFASGFQSLRRFNEAFKTRYQIAPLAFRRQQSSVCSDTLTLKVPIHLPYDWGTIITYLRRHETFGVERVEGSAYRRFIPSDEGFGSFAVSYHKGQDYLSVSFTNLPLSELRLILTRIKALFDTDHNPADLPKTKHHIAKGIRVPACFAPFETAVAVILNQLVSTEHAKTTIKKLVERFGQKIGDYNAQPVYAFPTPLTLATASIENLGVTKTKAGAIRALSQALLEQTLDFASYADFQITMQKLLEIKGIGPWTAAIISMRCLGNPDAFPESDLVIKRALAQGLASPAAWHTFRAYLVHCLWRDYGRSLSKVKGEAS